MALQFAIRTRKNLLGDTSPETIKRQLKDVLQDSDYGKVNLHPEYQRNIRWTPKAMNSLVDTVMNNGLVPPLIMYKLSADQKKEQQNSGKTFEMVDGQHRLYTLKAFYDSTYRELPHIKKRFVVHWECNDIDEDGKQTTSYVFYKETEDVIGYIEYCSEKEKNISFFILTDEDREWFDHYGLTQTIISSKLEIEQRREIFMSLQNGIPVRNSDFLKNKTECKLIAFINERKKDSEGKDFDGYEELMATFYKRCYKQASNFWVQWVCRCFLLYKHFHGKLISHKLKGEDVSGVFVHDDKSIKEMIDKKTNPEFNPRDHDIISDFDKVFRKFIDFLKPPEDMRVNPTQLFALTEDMRLNPTQLFALFYVLCDSSKDKDIIQSHMYYLSREGREKDVKTMWESRDKKQPRRNYFNSCLERLNAITERAPSRDGKQVTKRLKKKVWRKCETDFDNKCAVCESEEIREDMFHAGHIVARAMGGRTVISNLIPICIDCNRKMGTRNACEYKQDEYPHLTKSLV